MENEAANHAIGAITQLVIGSDDPVVTVDLIRRQLLKMYIAEADELIALGIDTAHKRDVIRRLTR